MPCEKRRAFGVEGPYAADYSIRACKAFSPKRVSMVMAPRLQCPNYKMLSFDDYVREAEKAHGHLCAGQVLGVRLAMLGLAKLGIEDPRGNREDRKRLVTFVEIDRCATDAIAVVTGCRLGKRALKFRDWGKMAATFVDLASHVGEDGKGTT